jgi:hypothetical protein
METCKEKYPEELDGKDVKNKIENFCKLLNANKVKASKEAFLELPLTVQCMFLHYGFDALKDEENTTAFYLFKLFTASEMKNIQTYTDFEKKKEILNLYKESLNWYKENKENGSGKDKATTKTMVKAKSRSGSKTTSKSGKKLKEYTVGDPLYVYYTTLYKEKGKKSKIAVKWLEERGIEM